MYESLSSETRKSFNAFLHMTLCTSSCTLSTQKSMPLEDIDHGQPHSIPQLRVQHETQVTFEAAAIPILPPAMIATGNMGRRYD